MNRIRLKQLATRYKYKMLIGVLLMLLWLLGFVAIVNNVFTWWTFIGIVVFWTINAFGWFGLLQKIFKVTRKEKQI